MQRKWRINRKHQIIYNTLVLSLRVRHIFGLSLYKKVFQFWIFVFKLPWFQKILEDSFVYFHPFMKALGFDVFSDDYKSRLALHAMNELFHRLCLSDEHFLSIIQSCNILTWNPDITGKSGIYAFAHQGMTCAAWQILLESSGVGIGFSKFQKPNDEDDSKFETEKNIQMTRDLVQAKQALKNDLPVLIMGDGGRGRHGVQCKLLEREIDIQPTMAILALSTQTDLFFVSTHISYTGLITVNCSDPFVEPDVKHATDEKIRQYLTQYSRYLGNEYQNFPETLAAHKMKAFHKEKKGGMHRDRSLNKTQNKL